MMVMMRNRKTILTAKDAGLGPVGQMRRASALIAFQKVVKCLERHIRQRRFLRDFCPVFHEFSVFSLRSLQPNAVQVTPIPNPASVPSLRLPFTDSNESFLDNMVSSKAAQVKAEYLGASSNKSKARLNQVANHITGAMASPFAVDVVPQAPEDPLFGLMAAYKADTFDRKVDLGIGAYRDDNAKPWVLPVVKKVGVFIRHSCL